MRCFGSMVPPTNTNRLSNQQSKGAACKKRFDEAMRHIDIISIIDKKRWQWLGHALRMSPTRNPHKALKLLDYTKGSLLNHLPNQYQQSDSLELAIELAKDRKNGKKFLKIEIGVLDLIPWACYTRQNRICIHLRYVNCEILEGLVKVLVI